MIRYKGRKRTMEQQWSVSKKEEQMTVSASVTPKLFFSFLLSFSCEWETSEKDPNLNSHWSMPWWSRFRTGSTTSADGKPSDVSSFQDDCWIRFLIDYLTVMLSTGPLYLTLHDAKLLVYNYHEIRRLLRWMSVTFVFAIVILLFLVVKVMCQQSRQFRQQRLIHQNWSSFIFHWTLTLLEDVWRRTWLVWYPRRCSPNTPWHCPARRIVCFSP